MTRRPILVLLDLMSRYLSLSGSSAYLYNQKVEAEALTSKGLFLVAQYESSDILSNNSEWIPFASGQDPTEKITVQTLERYALILMSQDVSAFNRKEELVAALRSIESADLQERYGFKINHTPDTIDNISDVQGSAMLNRYRVGVSLFAWYEFSRTAPDYETVRIAPTTEPSGSLSEITFTT